MIRTVDTRQWNQKPMQALSKDGKLLLHYLKLNEHCLSTGIYTLTPMTIQNETGLEPDDLPKLMAELAQYGEVIWWAEQDLIWVKNFLREQCVSSKFLIGVDRHLQGLDPELLKHFLKHNADMYVRWGVKHFDMNTATPEKKKGKYGHGKDR